jgi:hypothetical protein
MTNPKGNVYVEGRQLAVDAETVSAGSIEDSADGQSWETLKELGYETGDVLSTPVYNDDSFTDRLTTSSTYTGVGPISYWRPDTVVADPSDFRVGVALRLKASSDPVAIKVAAASDKGGSNFTETLFERTGLTGVDDVFLGWDSASLTHADEGQQATVLIRNDGDQSDAVGHRGMAVFVGDEL